MLGRDECFDFGRGDPLPGWRGRVRYHGERSSFQKLARTDDGELLEYLERRHVSEHFLVEIDMFLEAHPELVKAAPRFVHEFNTLPPLAAYKYFVKGYTRPARYVSGIIPEIEFTLPPGSSVRPLVDRFDVELLEFFNGYDYRYDILAKIDAEVRELVGRLAAGRPISRNARLLVSYHLWGNPADCYKWYEYNYQEEWLAHRYLPEHVVLSDLPKPADYAEPSAHVLPGPHENAQAETRRSFPMTRLRMAEACDQGVDVLDVLLDDFTAELMKRNLTRLRIEELRHRAQEALDYERARPTEKDIVDLVMDLAHECERLPPRHEKCLTFNFVQQPFPNFQFNLSNITNVDMNVPTGLSKKARKRARRRSKIPVTNFWSNLTGKRPEHFVNRLQTMRDQLARAYENERAECKAPDADKAGLMKERRNCERIFMRQLCLYADRGGLIGLGLRKDDLHKLRSTQFLSRAQQISAELLSLPRPDLLGLFPPTT